MSVKATALILAVQGFLFASCGFPAVLFLFLLALSCFFSSSVESLVNILSHGTITGV